MATVGGPGLGLTKNSFYYPSELYNAPVDSGSNAITLNAGDAVSIPPGNYLINPGRYSVVQYNDPIMGWRALRPALDQGGYHFVSDGCNLRVANLLGCPIGAVVTNGGTGYVQASTTVTASGGGTNSTWQAIVGGQVSVISVASAGSGYGVAPLVLIDSPASVGFPAAGYATIASGTVSGVTLTNVGAGYQTVPTVKIVPSPYDPNYASIVNATVSVGLTGSGKVTGVICTNPGAPLTTLSAISLTIAGVGTTAAATAVVLQTVQLASVVAAGAGYTANAMKLTTTGGVPSATPVFTNPDWEYTNFIPRACDITLAASLTSVSAYIDRGLFAGTPTPVIAGIVVPTTVASIALTMGTAQDTVFLQTLDR